MTYLSRRIRAWRLPRALLFSFAGVFVFLSLFTLQEAMNPERLTPDETVTYQGTLKNMRRTFFKSSLLLTFEIDGYCSEFVTPGFRPFHYQLFKKEYQPGMEVEFTVRKSELKNFETCQRCEIVALKSNAGAYLTLTEHNNSSYTAKRIVAGGITGALVTAGVISLVLALFSAKDSEEPGEVWERKSVFRRRVW